MSAPASPEPLEDVLAEARACTACVPHLPFGPLPLVRAGAAAPLLIVSQAPGTKAHETDLSFNDPSGDRLRDWLAMDRDTFYDPDRVAIVPMGFCYPGRLPKGGDAPPRPECAPLWHDRVFAALPAVRLTLYVGSYAIRHYLPGYPTMTAAVADWRTHAPAVLPLPHPSWRTTAWERKHAWFGAELLPVLRARVAEVLG
ncbi:MAG: uracil-DNA glycosylase family protein [Alphaproteobacteria bacterium]|nr:uracil-DNA glycosylase family protein [Alphaproteobacteria bacterium]